MARDRIVATDPEDVSLILDVSFLQIPETSHINDHPSYGTSAYPPSPGFDSPTKPPRK